MKSKVLKAVLVLMMATSMTTFAATVAYWDFEDGTAGASFASTGGTVDTANGYVMYGYNDYYGPSFSTFTPSGSGLSSSNADNHQDGYAAGSSLNNWSPVTWTIECSVYLEEMGGWETIIGRDGQTSGTAESDFYLSNNGIDDRFRLNIYTVGGGRYILDSRIVPVVNKWYGLAATSDGTTLTLYVDEGSGYHSVASMLMTGATPADNALGNAGGNNWTFGRGWYNAWFVDHIDGYLDDVRFSDVALAPSELIGIPEPAPLGVVSFSTTDAGVTKSLDFWGECQAWISRDNMTSCINYMGLSNIDVVRIPLDLSAALTYSGEVPVLPAAARSIIDSAMQQALRAPDAKLSIVPGGKGGTVNSWYIDTDDKIHPVRWVDAYVAAIHYVNSTYGYTMSDWALMEMFNEPDWDWSVGSQSNMAEVMAEYKTRTALASIPLLGPSTLDCSRAQSWYNAIATYTDIAGTHVINGSMSSLIAFINSVHAAHKPFINPEIHTLVESIIHAEYSDRAGEGGIFWGGITPAEGRFVQACRGKRIAYATDAVTWTAACGYRDLQQRVWMFAAANERHSLQSMWEFRCTDRDVFFDGVGAARSKVVELPAGTDYHVEVTWGDRNPLYYSQYVDNRGDTTRMTLSGSVLYTTSTSSTSTQSGWEFRPVGAFYYIDNVYAKSVGQNCRLSGDSSTQALLVSASSRTDDYAKWQLIKSGSSFHLENVGMQRASQNGRLKAGSGTTLILAASSDVTSQAVWNFSDTGTVDTTAPSAPTGLTAITGDSVIQLDWADSSAWDLASYSVYRRTNVGSFMKIAAGLTNSRYADTTADNNTNYHYVVTAVDGFGNESSYSNEAVMTAQAPAAYDDFQSGGWSGGSGWLSGWSTSGSPTVVTYSGNQAARITNTASITRTLSSPVYEGILYFKYDVGALEADDTVAAEIYDWIAAQWVTVWTGRYYDNGPDSVGGGRDTADGLQEQIVDVSKICPNVTQIRFRAVGNSSDDILFIDDVAVLPKTYGTPAVTVFYSDNMQTLPNGWDEGSNAASEAGASVGGIRVVDYGSGRFVQMNSWWDGAGWTKIWRSTGRTIAVNKKYTLKARMSGGGTTTLRLQNATESWANIAASGFTPGTTAAEYAVSFSTASGQNSSAVGDQLGIAVDPGWWNNMFLNRVIVEECHILPGK